MLYLHAFPPTKIISPPKPIDEKDILPILEKHIVDYHQPPAVTTNALVGSSLEKLVSALKGEKPDLTIHEEVVEEEEPQDVEMAELDFGTEVEGEGEADESQGQTVDREKRKKDKKERRKQERKKKLEENTKAK